LIPAEYSSFLVASTQASAALIGLLFVAVSIAPERVFGPGGEAVKRALALSAFTALANAFFASFGSLIPHLDFGVMVVVVGGAAGLQTLALLTMLPSWRRERTLIRSGLLFVVSAFVYGYEIAIGVQLLAKPFDPSLMTALLALLLGVFAIGLARAWELLGAPQGRGPFSLLTAWLERRAEPANTAKPEPPTQPPHTVGR
jgi:uncharacterized membrane protein YczE